MEENPSAPQELFPCPICKRKFLKDRLEVHLRSCDKQKKFAHGSNYDNSAFLKMLDSELAKEEKSSTYKSSIKEKEDPNKKFVDKLEKEMEKEKKESTYKPYQPKKVEVEDPNKKFLEKLDEEMKKDEEMHPQESNTKKTMGPGKKANKPDTNQDFLDKLEKEMEKDKQNPYVPYAKQKKKEPEEDYNKAFLDRLDAEMKNTEKYKPSERPKKAVQQGVRGGNYNKKDFEDKIKSEMDKEKASSTKAGHVEIICYICYKPINPAIYASHIKGCSATWSRNNIGKDINSIKPEKADEILKHPSNLSKEELEEYNENIFKNKDKMTFVPCENCARNVVLWKMEEHLKTCKPMHIGRPPKTSGDNAIKSDKNADLNKMIEDDQNQYAQVELVPCELCGKRINSDRMQAHLRVCKGRK